MVLSFVPFIPTRDVPLLRLKNALSVAVRSLIRARWNTVAAVCVLIVAVGGGQLVATVWQATIERGLSYRNPGEVVRVTLASEGNPDQRDISPHPSGSEVELLREEASSLTWIAAWSEGTEVLAGQRRARLVYTATVAPGTLDALGTNPVAGRLFRDGDHRAAQADDAAPTVVILNSTLAQGTFGGVEEAVGAVADFGDRRAEVIGVMPPDFVFPAPRTSAWLPEPATAASGSQIREIQQPTVARLAPGVSPRAAAAEATALLRRTGRRTEKDAVVLTPFAEAATASIRPTLEILRGGALLLLVVAAISVASLRLSQALAEQRATRIRRALGAVPGDEFAVAGIRILLLGGVVASGAALFSVWLLPVMRRAGAHLPFADEWAAGWGTGADALLPALAAAAIAEVPAIAETFRDRSGSAASETRTGGGRRPLMLPLLAAGTAASTIILIATTVLAGSAWAVLAGRGGYSGAGLGLLTVDFGGKGGEALPGAEKVRHLEALERRLESFPAVRSVGYADSLPDDRAGVAFAAGNDPEGTGSRVAIRRVSPDLLEVLRIPVVQGRGLLNSDRPPGEAVGVVDRSFADRNVPGDPLDQWVAVGFEGARVVGVVEDVMTFPVEDRWRTMYRPYTGDAGFVALDPRAERVEVVMRFNGAASPELLAAVAEIPAEVAPALRVLDVSTVRARRTGLLGSSVLASAILVVFGAAGLLLSVAGAVGHVVDTVVREAQSNAIRRALGAEPRSIVWRVIRRTAGATGLGVAAGLILGWVLTRAVGAAIPWVETSEPLLFLGPAAVVLLLILVIAAAVTGVRVQRTDTWALIRSL